MPVLYNLDHQGAILDPEKPAILPGEAHAFTDEEVAVLSGLWSENDPRIGLRDEIVFKKRRDAVPADDATPASPEVPEPDPGILEET